MVIIKKDDYISFINSSGVIKMPTTPANDNISTFLSGNLSGNNGGINPNNNTNLQIPTANQINTMTTIKRDSSQQQLEKLQQYTNQQNQLMQQQQQQQNQQFAKAQLNCRPNSHPFPVRFAIYSNYYRIFI
jgi:hypothetical protein